LSFNSSKKKKNLTCRTTFSCAWRNIGQTVKRENVLLVNGIKVHYPVLVPPKWGFWRGGTYPATIFAALSCHSEDLERLFQVNFFKMFEPLFATISFPCWSLADQCWLLTIPHRPWAIATVNYPCYLLLL